MSTITAGRASVAGAKISRARKLFEWAGYIAGVILIAFGLASIVMGVAGRGTVRDSLKLEKIVGSPDMTPAGIKQEAAAAGLKGVALPTCNVANQAIDTGSEARCFASYMRIHALEASGGLTYSQMPRYATANGKGTNNAATALKGANGQPQDNPARNLWVTETALSTALNTSYLAEQIGLFSVVVGVALLLSGIGFIVFLAVGGALRRRESAATGQ